MPRNRKGPDRLAGAFFSAFVVLHPAERDPSGFGRENLEVEADAVALLVPARRVPSLAWAHNFPRQTKLLQYTYDQEYPIEFPPAMTMSRRPWVRMVIVMPAFAARQGSDHPVVATFVIGLICAVAPQMRC
jgi:hypothetical protein